MTSNDSDIFRPLPPWISMASITGPHPTVIPGDYSSKPRSRSRIWQDGEVRIGPNGRPVTLRALPAISRDQELAMGRV